MPLLPELEMLFGPGSTKMSSLTGLKTCRGLGHLNAECRMQNADCGFRRRDADGDDRVGCVTTADGGERSARAPTATCEAHVLPGPGCSEPQARRYNPSSHRLDATSPRATGSTLQPLEPQARRYTKLGHGRFSNKRVVRQVPPGQWPGGTGGSPVLPPGIGNGYEIFGLK